MITRTTLRTAIALALLAPLLGGCFPRRLPTDEMPDTAAIPVSGQRETVNLAVAPIREDTVALLGPAVLTLGDPSRIHVAIRPHGHPLESGRIEQVRQSLASLGIKDGLVIVAPPSDVADGRFEVTLDRWTAGQPNCDALQRPSDMEQNGQRPSMAFGCATVSNLSSMLDDPGDLVQPRTLGPVDATSQVEAVRRYQNNTVTPLNQSTATNH